MRSFSLFCVCWFAELFSPMPYIAPISAEHGGHRNMLSCEDSLLPRYSFTTHCVLRNLSRGTWAGSKQARVGNHLAGRYNLQRNCFAPKLIHYRKESPVRTIVLPYALTLPKPTQKTGRVSNRFSWVHLNQDTHSECNIEIYIYKPTFHQIRQDMTRQKTTIRRFVLRLTEALLFFFKFI